MAYDIKYRPHRCRARMSAYRTFEAQGEDLARKAVVDLAAAWGIRAIASFVCSRPNPDYALCNAFNDVANKQEQKAANSLLTLGFVALLATIIE